jgi:hypothetical protein
MPYTASRFIPIPFRFHDFHSVAVLSVCLSLSMKRAASQRAALQMHGGGEWYRFSRFSRFSVSGGETGETGETLETGETGERAKKLFHNFPHL